MGSEVENSQGHGASVAVFDGDQGDESDPRVHGFDTPALRRDNPSFSEKGCCATKSSSVRSPGKSTWPAPASDGVTILAAREATGRRVIGFDYPVDASPSVCRIAADTEVDT